MNQHDVQLIWDNETGEGDIAFVRGDFKRGKPLESAVMLSIFCDARVPEQPLGMRRGWWGDLLKTVAHETGSRIWHAGRATITKNTMNMVKSYCEKCLNWLITDKVADTVAVTVESDTVTYPTAVRLSVVVSRGNIVLANVSYDDFWNAQMEE